MITRKVNKGNEDGPLLLGVCFQMPDSYTQNLDNNKSKGKVIPLQARCGPEGG
jgi:hypothetical protein